VGYYFRLPPQYGIHIHQVFCLQTRKIHRATPPVPVPILHYRLIRECGFASGCTHTRNKDHTESTRTIDSPGFKGGLLLRQNVHENDTRPGLEWIPKRCVRSDLGPE
jgi:hypothetical protein